jgi:hypothetical protein
MEVESEPKVPTYPPNAPNANLKYLCIGDGYVSSFFFLMYMPQKRQKKKIRYRKRKYT